MFYNPTTIGLWVGVFVFVIWCLAEYRQPNSNLAPQWFVEMPESNKAVWLAFRVMGSIIVVPIAEELFFRGFVVVVALVVVARQKKMHFSCRKSDICSDKPGKRFLD